MSAFLVTLENIRTGEILEQCRIATKASVAREGLLRFILRPSSGFGWARAEARTVRLNPCKGEKSHGH
jgi:hypothetical protein